LGAPPSEKPTIRGQAGQDVVGERELVEQGGAVGPKMWSAKNKVTIWSSRSP
jgi:hypothetical protein